MFDDAIKVTPSVFWDSRYSGLAIAIIPSSHKNVTQADQGLGDRA